MADAEALAGVEPSYFELLTAAAFRWFADVAVDVAVVEVGLLGRWDATNVADGQVAVVTNVGLDHTDVAGPTGVDIAAEKAGIVKPGASLVLGETDPELVPVFLAERPGETLRRATSTSACNDNILAVGGRLLDLRTPGAAYDELFLPLHGAHQGDNAAAALAAVEAFFGGPLAPELVTAGFENVVMPGRFEVVGRHPLHRARRRAQPRGRRRRSGSRRRRVLRRRRTHLCDRDAERSRSRRHARGARRGIERGS